MSDPRFPGRRILYPEIEPYRSGQLDVGDGAGDTAMTFTGTLADINTALATASYTPTANYNGTATITLNVTDTFGGIGSEASSAVPVFENTSATSGSAPIRFSTSSCMAVDWAKRVHALRTPCIATLCSPSVGTNPWPSLPTRS